MTLGQIVVGIDSSAASAAAAAWATFHSGITRRNVVLAHEGGGPQRPDEPETSRFAGTGTIVDGLVRSGLAAGVRIDAVTGENTAVDGLLRWSSTADLLALGAPAKSHPRLLGQLTDHLAATALCPVALIKPSYRPPAAAGGPVLVGMVDGPAARLSLRFAAAEAARMNTELVIVRAGQDHLDLSMREDQELAGIHTRFPRLSVTALEADGDPGEVLVELSAAAQLVVVGAHHSSDPWSIRLGPVTETVLRRAPCPVISVGRWHPDR